MPLSPLPDRVDRLFAAGLPGIRVNASQKTVAISSDGLPMTISVLPRKQGGDTRIRVTGFKRRNRLDIVPLNTPTRLLLDMFTAVPGFKTVELPVDGDYVTDFRVGHHPEKVRIVLGIKGVDVPAHQVVYEPDGFTLIVQPPANAAVNGVKTPENSASGKSVVNGNVNKAEISAVGSSPGVTGDELRNRLLTGAVDDGNNTPFFHIAAQDTGPDVTLFMQAVAHYHNNEWASAITQLETLAGKYPKSPYGEKAQFLLPLVYEKSYADSLDVHFRELSERYRDVISRFPSSDLVAEAMLRMGNLYHQMKNYAEAQGYYNIALNNSPPTSTVALQAKLQTAKIFCFKKKEQEAEVLLQSVIDDSRGIALKSEAMMELAKILYNQNAFHKSLDLLSKLVTIRPDNVYRMPEVALYMGNNNFQLGHNTQARNQLFQYYNSTPDSEENHMILARIGDTYLEDGRIQDAVKLFLLVCKRYPGTMGANISWIRLAEQQEANPDVASFIPMSSRQIYEKVYGFFMEKNRNDPLALLAMLKLGVLYQKEKAYDQSLKALKTFFSYTPRGALKENGIFALQNTLNSMINDAEDRGDSGRVIAIYERDKKLFNQVFFAEPVFLVVARAYLDLGLKEKAVELFQRMDSLLSDKEKSEDLLYYTGEQAFENQQVDRALSRLSLLLKKYPKGKYAGRATLLMAKCLFKQKKYSGAMDLFDAALKYDLSRCEKTKLLIHLAEAALKTGARERAMAAVLEAEKSHGACVGISGYLGDEIGTLFLELKAPEKAVAVFNRLLEMNQSQLGKASLKYKIAQCLDRLGRTQESLGLYEEVAAMEDPFWSRLAKENIAAVEFSKEVQKEKKQ